MSVNDEFEEDLRKVFGDKVNEFPPTAKDLLADLWNAAHRRGRQKADIVTVGRTPEERGWTTMKMHDEDEHHKAMKDLLLKI